MTLTRVNLGVLAEDLIAQGVSTCEDAPARSLRPEELARPGSRAS